MHPGSPRSGAPREAGGDRQPHGRGHDLRRARGGARTAWPSLLRHEGLQAGRPRGLLLENTPRYLEVAWAALRAGLYVTPINWHLGPVEAGYIIEDCDATALITLGRLRRHARGRRATRWGPPASPRPRRRPRRLRRPGPGDSGPMPSTPIADESMGLVDVLLLGHDGTTQGHPAAAHRCPPRDAHQLRRPLGQRSTASAPRPSTCARHRSTTPHPPAGRWRRGPDGRQRGDHGALRRRGGPRRHRALPGDPRPVRAHPLRSGMLKLPAEVRARYDLSSLEMVVHAAAPCPVEVKRPDASTGRARSSTSSTPAARATASAPSAPRSGWPTPARWAAA